MKHLPKLESTVKFNKETLRQQELEKFMKQWRNKQKSLAGIR